MCVGLNLNQLWDGVMGSNLNQSLLLFSNLFLQVLLLLIILLLFIFHNYYYVVIIMLLLLLITVLRIVLV